MKKDVFQNCPTYQSERFEIRKMEMKDAHGLFQCYSNPQAARYFNGDCCGDDFYYTDYEKFLECMKFWESRYQVVDEQYQQYDLFTDPAELEREHRMQEAILDIKEKFGKNAILKGIDLQAGATTMERKGEKHVKVVLRYAFLLIGDSIHR